MTSVVIWRYRENKLELQGGRAGGGTVGRAARPPNIMAGETLEGYFNVKYQKALLPLVDFDKSLVLEFCDLTTDQAPFLLLPPFLLILLFI